MCDGAWEWFGVVGQVEGRQVGRHRQCQALTLSRREVQRAAAGGSRRKAHGDKYECAVSWGLGAAHGRGVGKSCYCNMMHGGHPPVWASSPPGSKHKCTWWTRAR